MKYVHQQERHGAPFALGDDPMPLPGQPNPLANKYSDAMQSHFALGGPEQVSSSEYFKGKKVALFSVPGAFTPTCSMAHLPGYVVNADALKAKGVDSIVCLSVMASLQSCFSNSNSNDDRMVPAPEDVSGP